MDKRRILLLAGLLAGTCVLAQEQAYRWVDEDGVVHFSDRPKPGAEADAERIEIPKANVTNVRRLQVPGQDADVSAESDEPFSYESLTIASPAAEETLWNIEGVLNVSLALSPGLQPGHQVRVYFDGQSQIVQSLNFQLEEVWRGVHNLQAEVLDETGQLMIRSEASRFYVQQNRVAF